MSWVVNLGPYDLAAVAFSEPDVRLLQPQATLLGNAAESMAQRIRELHARAVVLRNPPPLNVLDNPGFQDKPGATDPVPGWAVSQGRGVSVTTDTTQGHAMGPGQGRQAKSARIASDGPIASLVSQPFPAPSTGRIMMSVWLRVADASRQPELWLAVQGKRFGRDYYRYAPVGQTPAPRQAGRPIATTWGQYIVQFDDLPLDGLTQMRIRVNLMGAGEVSVKRGTDSSTWRSTNQSCGHSTRCSPWPTST